MGHLRTGMEHDMVLRGLREQTARAYLRSVMGLTRHYGRAPDTLTLDEVKSYLCHLPRSSNAPRRAWPTRSTGSGSAMR